jgi:hypothetical protein
MVIMAAGLGMPGSATAEPPRALFIHDLIDFTGLCDPADGLIRGVVADDSMLCAGGTFEDHTIGISNGTLKPGSPAAIHFSATIQRTYDCGDAGTFEMSFNPHQVAGSTTATDRFVIGSGTGSFAGIHGEGAWTFYNPEPDVSFGCELQSGEDSADGSVQFSAP